MIQTEIEADQARESYQACFPGEPVVLMSLGPGGTFLFSGRPDLVEFLETVDLSEVPWKTYSTP